MNPIVYQYWLRPVPLGPVGTVPSPEGPLPRLDRITFRIEPESLIANDRYRYICMDCYSASGSREAFSTDCAYIRDMKHGPTPSQQSQIGNHARQHSIMWSWAKSLEGK